MIKINQIITELSNGDLTDIYETDEITQTIVVHYALKYKEVLDMFKRYKLDLAIFNEEMLSYIKKFEAVKKSYRVGNNGIYLNPRSFSRQTLSGSYLTIANLAQQIEIKNLRNDQEKIQELTIMHNNEPFSIEVSFLSFLESFLKYAQSDKKFSYFYDILLKSNFNINKFIEDAKTGFIRKKSSLDSICENLNELVSKNKISKVIGREKEINSLILTLSKHRKNNPVLIGKAGVGKTAIAEGLAEMIEKGNVPESLKNATVYNLQIAKLISGTSFRGQFEQKVMDLLKEFKEKEEDGEMPILFIDEIHSIVGSGNSNGLDLSNILKPALARGELRTIGATTTNEWFKFIDDDKALKRRFIPITVKEPNKEETFQILMGGKESYEEKHQVKYSINSLIRAVELSNEFIEDNAQPDKSFDLIDVAGAMCQLENKTEVNEEDIEFALKSIKDISLDAIQYTKRKHVIPIENRLKQSVFGQDHAIESIANSVELNLAGIGDSSKPIGSFLFVGPTGVGKTELAKNLAKEMNAHFERIDMSEYMDEMSITKLLGSALGYVGYDQGSSLTKVLQENPRTVLLLDEIEKAHPKIFNLLLQAMDNAQITDAKGNKISFKNVILIMTSNAGAREMEKGSIGLSSNSSNNKTKEALKSFFAPEFRGRLTSIVNFNPMNKDLMDKIFERELSLLNLRLNQKNVNINISNDLKEQIIANSLKEQLGARPLKNILNNEIALKISKEILYGKLKNLDKLKNVTMNKNKKGELTLKIIN